MSFHDAHCHLSDKFFLKDIDSYFTEWRSLGLTAVISVATKLSESTKNFELADLYTEVIPGVGLHPWKAKRQPDHETMNVYKELLLSQRTLVIGEVGLDYHFIKNEDLYHFQEEWFCFFLSEAEKHSLPLNIHAKGAEQRVSELLDTFSLKPHKVLLHWYSGSERSLMKLNDQGYFFSVNPSLLTGSTHKRVLEFVPLEHLLTESDGNVSYTISGEKFVGSPSLIPVVIKEMSNMLNLPVETLQNQLETNLQRYLN